MKIALVGATDFAGTVLLDESLRRGHQVTAIVRNPTTLTRPDDHLTVVAGDVNPPHQLASLLNGNDLVLSVYSPGWGHPDLCNAFLAGSRAIERAAAQASLPCLVVMGGAGSLFVNGQQLMDGPNFPAEHKTGASAARDYLAELRHAQQLNWPFFSPAIEMHPGIDTGRTGHYRLGTDGLVFNLAGRNYLSMQDVAVLDEAEHSQFSRSLAGGFRAGQPQYASIT